MMTERRSGLKSAFGCLPLITLLLPGWAGCSQPPSEAQAVSPDGRIQVRFLLRNGAPYYEISHDGQPVILPSRLGFVFKEAPPLNNDLHILTSAADAFDETWEQPWGEVRQVRNHYNQLVVEMEENAGPHRRLDVVFRVYDDGVGFRYRLPKQDNLQNFQIMDELTEFALAGNYSSWWIPAYQDNRYEYLYRNTPVDEIEVVHTPMTMETEGGLSLSIHEAALTDYASMTLRRKEGTLLECDLVPWSDGVKVKAATPLETPWRTIQIARDPGGLITSNLILNLNDPNRLSDVSWIKPGKYVGIWWGMHLGICTWGSGPHHGATTARTKEYIDFAAQHGFSGVLVEGWNEGWDGDWIANGDVFSFTKPYPDFDIEELSRYAAEKGVELIGHNETSAGIDNYERQMEDAFAFYERLGIHRVKTGYVGTRANKTEWHHGQFMVRHYRKVIEAAARHHIMLDVHEPIKDTGIRRTYPNMMTREGARGMEYDAWSPDGGNPPEHTAVLPFTRLLAGPFDFTPGIFDLLFEKERPENRSNTTLAKQLAFYVVIYSPLQMAADLPENYRNQPAFKFIEDVPCDWEETRVLHAKIGDYVTIARKDRNSPDWYLGSLTDEQGRTLEADLSFLDPGRKYVAEIYADGPKADWKTNPYDILISQETVDSTSHLTMRLAPGGGAAVRLYPADDEN